MDLRVMPSARSLLISGTNSSGKTVAMKLFRLVAVMAKLGIPIIIDRRGARHRPRVDFFKNVFDRRGRGRNLNSIYNDVK